MAIKLLGPASASKRQIVLVIALGLAALLLIRLASHWRSPIAESRSAYAAAPFANSRDTDLAIHFLENKLKSDPEDAGAFSKLAGYHLQRLRETGSTQYLVLALGAARSSLAVTPAERNVAGLTELALSEYAGHEFGAARDDSQRLVELDPGQSSPYGILADASLELGEYGQATEAFRQMAARGGGASSDTRLARLASLQGDTDLAQQRLFNGLALALDTPFPSAEAVAWCQWQMGDTAFSVGDYDTAEQRYREALTTLPGYMNALASLGRVLAARGDLQGATEQYEQAVLRLPDPTFVGALGDLYELSGRATDAAAQYALVEQIGHLSALNGTLYNRQLALFYADHDLKSDEAYADAAGEYASRRDIYGADTVAWTALKAGKIPEAQQAIQEALRLGTRDARLYYHAGMISLGAGDTAAGRAYLQEALTLNPGFDPLQARLAARALGE